jgi:hypothetical protein
MVKRLCPGSLRPSGLALTLSSRAPRHYVRVSKDQGETFAPMSESSPWAADNLIAMPMEGHWRRVNTPLRRLTARERNVVIAGLAVTLVAIVGLILATAGDSQPPPAAGCLRVVVAGRVGGELLHPCDDRAVALCRRSATFDSPRSRTIVEACREAGIRS